MPQAVKAKCPGCQQVLHFPADWLRETVRCKHCGLLLQPKPKVMPADSNGLTKAVPTTSPNESLENGTVAAPPSGHDLFSFGGPSDGEPSTALARYRRRARRRTLKSFAVTLVFVGLVGGTIYWNWDNLSARLKQAGIGVADNGGRPTDPTPPGDGRAGVKPPPKGETSEAAVVFPRRLLAVSVHNYLYANPVSTGAFDDEGPKQTIPDRTFHTVVNRLAEFLHVPPGQVVELSDAAPANLAQPPLKPIIESTVRDFLAGCRKQDRAVLMFVGHAVEIGDEAFLVPIEGELQVKETLIPLRWLYEQLATCKAQQKLLILDTNRFNPARGLERPAGGPMGPKLDAALQNPPPGVQVWSACVAGQYSYEGFLKVGDGVFYTNGLFTDALADCLGVHRVNPGIQTPASPLPVEALADGNDKSKGVNRGTEAEASEDALGHQTPRLSGRPAAEAVPYDPHEPLPPPVAIQLPAPPEGGRAPRDLVQKILDEIESKMAKEGEQPVKAETLPVFSAARLAEYADDGAMTPFREEVIKTARLLKKHARTFKEDFRGQGDNAAIKALILERQKDPARAFGELMGQLETLKEAGESRSEEKSKRWRANYDYVLARLEARLAYVYEYNYMLGQIRKDNLPKRDPAKQSGYRLASQETLKSGSESRKLAADAKKLLAKIAETHRGTPWEVLAKRQALNALGLEWQPIP